MIAGSHDIHARREELFGNARRDRKAASGVLNVRDDKIYFVLAAHLSQPLLQHSAPRASDRIATQVALS